VSCPKTSGRVNALTRKGRRQLARPPSKRVPKPASIGTSDAAAVPADGLTRTERAHAVI